MDIIHTDINRIKGRHSRPCFRRGKLVPAKAGSGNPGVVPAKAGNQGLAYWIPPYQVRGRLSQARNDKLHNTYIAIYRNQSGAALVIALIMMVVLTLIGLASIFSSTFEIRLSGNKRGSTDAFYGADSGVQVTMANIENFNLARYGTNHKYENVLNDAANVNPNPTNAYIVLYHDTSQTGAPRGSGMGTHVDFIHFLVTSTAQDQTELSLTKSACTIEQKVVRLIPAAE